MMPKILPAQIGLRPPEYHTHLQYPTQEEQKPSDPHPNPAGRHARNNLTADPNVPARSRGKSGLQHLLRDSDAISRNPHPNDTPRASLRAPLPGGMPIPEKAPEKHRAG